MTFIQRPLTSSVLRISESLAMASAAMATHTSQALGARSAEKMFAKAEDGQIPAVVPLRKDIPWDAPDGSSPCCVAKSNYSSLAKSFTMATSICSRLLAAKNPENDPSGVDLESKIQIRTNHTKEHNSS
jgi:hypothetical protein